MNADAATTNTSPGAGLLPHWSTSGARSCVLPLVSGEGGTKLHLFGKGCGILRGAEFTPIPQPKLAVTFHSLSRRSLPLQTPHRFIQPRETGFPFNNFTWSSPQKKGRSPSQVSLERSICDLSSRHGSNVRERVGSVSRGL